MFIVEQNANLALDIADRAYVLEAGRDRPSRERRRPARRRRGAPRRTWGSRRHHARLLAFPGIEENFFTLTLFLQNLTNALANGAVYALMALTVVMIYKTTGHLNFAQGEMAMFSTFVVYVLADRAGLAVWLAIVIVVIGVDGRRGRRSNAS